MANLQGKKKGSNPYGTPQQRGYAQIWSTREARDKLAMIGKALGVPSVSMVARLVPLAERLMANSLKLPTQRDRRLFFEIALEVLTNPTDEIDELVLREFLRRVEEKNRPTGQQAYNDMQR